MPRTRIKICGITCEEDALLAVNAGADAIGLIFHPPAARGISLFTAERIVAALPPFVTPIGLFVDTHGANVQTIATKLRLNFIQLHGQETPQFVRDLAPLGVIKAVHVKPGKLRESLQIWHEACAAGIPNLRALVLETGWGKEKGGTGIENDWEQIRQAQLAGDFDGLPPVILAGGLRPSNVGNVIQMLHPFAVDVSSGVEEIKGRKSNDLILAFVHAVRLADHNCNPPSAI